MPKKPVSPVRSFAEDHHEPSGFRCLPIWFRKTRFWQTRKPEHRAIIIELYWRLAHDHIEMPSGIILERGQWAMSMESLAEAAGFGPDRDKARGAIHALIEAGVIITQRINARYATHTQQLTLFTWRDFDAYDKPADWTPQSLTHSTPQSFPQSSTHSSTTGYTTGATTAPNHRELPPEGEEKARASSSPRVAGNFVTSSPNWAPTVEAPPESEPARVGTDCPASESSNVVVSASSLIASFPETTETIQEDVEDSVWVASVISDLAKRLGERLSAAQFSFAADKLAEMVEAMEADYGLQGDAERITRVVVDQIAENWEGVLDECEQMTNPPTRGTLALTNCGVFVAALKAREEPYLTPEAAGDFDDWISHTVWAALHRKPEFV